MRVRGVISFEFDELSGIGPDTRCCRNGSRGDLLIGLISNATTAVPPDGAL